MPVYKDLYDLIRSIVQKEISKVEKEFERIEKELREELGEFNSPLYTVYENDDYYYYLIDVPNLDLSTVFVKIEKGYLKIKCKDKLNKSYALNIPLPDDADSDTLTLSRAKWLLRISLKRKK